jgi:hypothetical protein
MGSTYVEFLPTGYDPYTEFGRFRLRIKASINSLNVLCERDSLPGYDDLLEWFRHCDKKQGISEVEIPENLHDLVRCFIHDFWSQTEVCEIFCTECNRGVAPSEISMVEWDNPIDAGIITIGDVGVVLRCPLGHDLVRKRLRIY